jgi:hypothetical protein
MYEKMHTERQVRVRCVKLAPSGIAVRSWRPVAQRMVAFSWWPSGWRREVNGIWAQRPAAKNLILQKCYLNNKTALIKFLRHFFY